MPAVESVSCLPGNVECEALVWIPPQDVSGSLERFRKPLKGERCLRLPAANLIPKRGFWRRETESLRESLVRVESLPQRQQGAPVLHPDVRVLGLFLKSALQEPKIAYVFLPKLFRVAVAFVPEHDRGGDNPESSFSNGDLLMNPPAKADALMAAKEP